MFPEIRSRLLSYNAKGIHLIVFVLLSLLVAACQPEVVITPLIGPAQSQPINSPDQGLKTVECAFDLPEDADIQCATLEVPLDYNLELGEMVELQVVIFGSEDPNPAPDPVFYLGSGPFSSIFFGGRGGGRTISLLREERVVYRFSRLSPETEDAETTTCPGIEAAFIDSLQASIIPEQVAQTTLDAYQTCREELVAAGIELDAMSAEQTARDILSLYRSLRIEQVNLFGFENSTQAALQALQIQPDAFRSVVLARFYPPMSIVDQQASYTYSLQRLFGACAGDEICNAAFPDLENKFRDVLEQLDETPLVLEVRRPNDPQMVTIRVDDAAFLIYLRYLLDSDDDISRIPLIIDQIYSGDGYKIAADVQNLFMFRPFQQQGVEFTNVCSDQWTANAIASIGESNAYPLLQEALGANYNQLAQLCMIWRQADFPPPHVKTPDMGIPFLILQGAYDPYFAPLLAEDWLRGYSEAQLVIFPHQGSGVFIGGDCSVGIVANFLADPTADVDSSCLEANSLVFQRPIQ